MKARVFDVIVHWAEDEEPSGSMIASRTGCSNATDKLSADHGAD